VCARMPPSQVCIILCLELKHDSLYKDMTQLKVTDVTSDLDRWRMVPTATLLLDNRAQPAESNRYCRRLAGPLGLSTGLD
jgi:hypothetical protein